MTASTALLALIVGLIAPDDAPRLAPVDPYLLTSEAGPFMILAHTYRGPNAEWHARDLASELRNRYGLPAYLVFSDDLPGKGLRSRQEVAVLVGDEKSLEGSARLLKVVQRLRPEAMDRMPAPVQGKRSLALNRATRTTNPHAPADRLFPKRRDD